MDLIKETLDVGKGFFDQRSWGTNTKNRNHLFFLLFVVQSLCHKKDVSLSSLSLPYCNKIGLVLLFVFFSSQL